MSIASDIIREHTDTIILSALLLRDSYGYEINKLLLGCRGHGCPQKILPHNPHRHR